jgi:tripartite ATP-independent transporter DctP family solute receptor
MKTRKGISFVCLAVMLVSVAFTVSAADKFVVKIANVTAVDHPLNVSYEKWAKLMNERSGGRIQATVYPGGQLGTLRTIAEGIQMGTIEIGTQSPGGLASFWPMLGVLELPYAYRSNEHVYHVVDGPIGQELNEAFRQKTGIRILGYWMNLYRNTTNNKRPIVKPEDFKGLKIRVPETKTVMDTIAAYGGNPVPMAFGEVYTALSQGIIDGQENPLSIIWASKLYEVQKYLSLTGHVYSPTVTMISDSFWKKLPKDLQEIVVQTFEEVRPQARKIVEDDEKALVDQLKAKGMQVNVVDPAIFAVPLEPLYAAFIKANGKEAQVYLDRIKATK